MRPLLILLLMLGLILPVQAQESTPEATPTPDIVVEIPTPQTAMDWANLGLFIVGILAVSVIAVIAMTLLARQVPAEHASTYADSLERAFNSGKAAAAKSTTPWDDFGFSLSEPALKRIITILRERGDTRAAALLERELDAAKLPTIPPVDDDHDTQPLGRPVRDLRPPGDLP